MSPYRSTRRQAPESHPPSDVAVGWRCPVCERVYAPYIAGCDPCNAETRARAEVRAREAAARTALLDILSGAMQSWRQTYGEPPARIRMRPDTVTDYVRCLDRIPLGVREAGPLSLRFHGVQINEDAALSVPYRLEAQ